MPENMPNKNPVRDASEIVEQDRSEQIRGERLGQASIFTCPDCGGTLWQVNEPELVLFRCHVGHVLTGALLLSEQTRDAENALWKAIRTLTDKMLLSRQLAIYARNRGDGELAEELDTQAVKAEQKVNALRQIAESD